MGDIELHTGSLDLYMIDYQKGLTSQLINIIDEKLYDLIRNSHIDDEIIFGSIEHIVGLGFVVLQQYMTVVCGNLQKNKKDVLSKGPKYKDGKTFSEIVNASANYWKHSSEWPLDKNCRDKDKRIKAIEAILRSFSDNDDYPLVNILSELSHTEKRQFNAVFKKILEWRNELTQ